jgi:hypothetical protein
MSEQDDLDRYRYLQLKQKMVNGSDQPVAEEAPPLPVNQIISNAVNSAVMGPATATKDFFQADPATVQKVGGSALPIVGGALAGPAGAIGGEALRQITGTAFAPETVPKTALGRGASMLSAGVMQEPSAFPGVPQATQVLKAVASKLGVGAKRVMEAASGVPAKDIQNLYENPETLITLGSKAKAGEAIGQAKLAAGVDPGITDSAITFTPENITKAIHSDSLGEEAIHKVAQANLSGATPEVEDIGDGLKFISKKIKAGMSKGEDVSELINIQNHLNSTLEKVAPAVQDARQEFAPLAQRDKFMKLFPANKNGTLSKANLFYLNSGLAWLGGAVGGLPGAGASVLAGTVARAPITTGITTALAGAANKGLNVIGQNPQARQILLGLLQKITQGQSQ